MEHQEFNWNAWGRQHSKPSWGGVQMDQSAFQFPEDRAQSEQ